MILVLLQMMITKTMTSLYPKRLKSTSQSSKSLWLSKSTHRQKMWQQVTISRVQWLLQILRKWDCHCSKLTHWRTQSIRVHHPFKLVHLRESMSSIRKRYHQAVWLAMMRSMVMMVLTSILWCKVIRVFSLSKPLKARWAQARLHKRLRSRQMTMTFKTLKAS